MSEPRLIDAKDIHYLMCSVYWGEDQETGKDVYRRTDIAFKSDIDELTTIDPETLPIVQELREELEQAEKEIKALKVARSPNCISCDMMHQNGNCLAVGGFCTAVPAAYCKLIPELKEKLARYEQAEKEERGKRNE